MVIQNSLTQHTGIANTVTDLVNCQIWACQLQRFVREGKLSRIHIPKMGKLCSATLR